MTTIAWNSHMVQPPRSSKPPKPRAVAANMKSGKQQGENRTITTSPMMPNLSMLPANFMIVLLGSSLYLYKDKQWSIVHCQEKIALSFLSVNYRKKPAFPEIP